MKPIALFLCLLATDATSATGTTTTLRGSSKGTNRDGPRYAPTQKPTVLSSTPTKAPTPTAALRDVQTLRTLGGTKLKLPTKSPTLPPTHSPTTPPTKRPTLPPTPPPTPPECAITVAARCKIGGTILDCSELSKFVTASNCANVQFHMKYEVTNTGTTSARVDQVTGEAKKNLASQFLPNPLHPQSFSAVAEFFSGNVCNGAVIQFPVVVSAQVFPSGSWCTALDFVTLKTR